MGAGLMDTVEGARDRLATMREVLAELRIEGVIESEDVSEFESQTSDEARAERYALILRRLRRLAR